MARKETITIDVILDTAFAMTREEGFANVTARKVAAKAGCSTQPIFRVYKSMEELWDAVYLRAVAFFQDYCGLYPRNEKFPFVDMAMAYIAFAKEEKYLFELLFVEKSTAQSDSVKSIYEIVNGAAGNVIDEIMVAEACGCANPQAVFVKMWYLVHGMACMTLNGNYELPVAETRAVLEEAYLAFAGIK